MTQLMASDKWKQLPWKKFQRIVFRLQRRIWKAQKANNYRLVRQLQKLLLRSQAAKFLAVRQVTQLNKGKKTAGVDGIKSLSPKQRLILVQNLKLNTEKASPTLGIGVRACPFRGTLMRDILIFNIILNYFDWRTTTANSKITWTPQRFIFFKFRIFFSQHSRTYSF